MSDTAPAYVIIHDSWGVFLGSAERLFATFWTHQFDTGAPTDVAPSYDTPDEALRVVRSWGVQDRHWLSQVRTHRVVPDIFLDGDQRFVSMQACIAAGLRAWIAEEEVAALVGGFDDEDPASGGSKERVCPHPRPH
jgi:hypothetical protein